VIRVDAGKLFHFPGGYDYYLSKIAATSAQAALTAGSAPVEPSKAASEEKASSRSREQKRLEAEERQVRYLERKAQTEIVQTLEKAILALEARQKTLTEELQKPDTYEKTGYAAKLNRELGEVSADLAVQTQQWEAEAAKLMELDEK
jgi:ATP-binding cassette subfamily F protein 3